LATKRFCPLPVLLSLLLLSAPARAVTGNDLRAWCATLDLETLSNAEAMAYVQCLAYVQGVVDGLIVLASAPRSSEQLVCMPDSLSYTEAANLARKYLEKYPGRRQLSAARVMTSALQEAFPCPRP
jgi:hypothetical protein